MTESQINQLRQYIRSIADDYGLKDWSIEFEGREPINPEANGQQFSPYAQRKAEIRINHAIIDDAELLRRVVIHELTHCHIDQLWHWMETEVKEWLGISRNQSEQMYSTFRLLAEFHIDGITRGIESKYPLIEWHD